MDGFGRNAKTQDLKYRVGKEFNIKNIKIFFHKSNHEFVYFVKIYATA